MRRELVHLLNRDETADASTDAVLRRFWKVANPSRTAGTAQTLLDREAPIIDLATHARAMRARRT